MASQLIRQTNGNLEIKLVIAWTDLQKAYESEVEKAVAETEITGFRKGKAPRSLVEPKLDQNHLYSHALQAILPKQYAAAVSEHKLKPILNPQIRLDKSDPQIDWEVTCTTCEAPQVDLKSDYQAEVKKLKFDKPDEKLFTILEYLHSQHPVIVPDLLVEEEANHRLAGLVENISKLGMTVDNYLQAKKTSVDELKASTATAARRDLEIEFILESVRQSQKLKSRKDTLDYLLSLA